MSTLRACEMESHVSVPADPPLFVRTRNRISIYWIYNPKIDHIFPFYYPKLFTLHSASRNFHLHWFSCLDFYLQSTSRPDISIYWFSRPGFLFTTHFASRSVRLLCCFASWISIYNPRVPKFLPTIIRVPNFSLL